MKHLAGTHFIIALLILLLPGTILAQGQATVLDPISPLEVKPVNRRPLIAADGQGRVMIVYVGKQDGDTVLWSLLSSGGAWSDAEVPLPPEEERWQGYEFYDLAGRNGQFALLLKNWGHRYYVLWSGGSWSTPVEIPDDQLEKPVELGFDGAGNLIAWDPGPRPIFGRLSGGAWETMELPQRHETRTSCPPGRLILGRTGALHILGENRVNATGGVVAVGSCPAGADPMQPSSWVYQPEGFSTEHSGGPTRKSDVGYALDWPRQTVWMCWEGTGREDRGKIFVSHAPIGATQEAQWQTWEMAVDDRKVYDQQLASSGAGAVGVAYAGKEGDDPNLWFRWLPPTGLGQELDIVRPGSQTEAADFQQLFNNMIALAIAPDGTAHVIIKGKKRGEYPENAERIYYSRVSGGAVLQNEPAVGGGSTTIATGGDTGEGQPDQPAQDWQQQGGKPDLQPLVSLSDDMAYEREGQVVYRCRQYHQTVRPEVSIRNNASQYFGDLEVDVIADGVVVHYVDHDESEHMRPMVERDDELDISLRMPRLKYEFRPEEGWEPPVLHVEDLDRGKLLEMHSSLGRKTIRVIVDPGNKIDEANEDNNVAELEYEVSGAHEQEDQMRVERLDGRPLVIGYNDLAILGTPKLYANTPIAAPGLVQRPAEARLIVGNPRRANFFAEVPVVARLDDQEIWRQVIPLIDDTRRLRNEETQWFGYTAPAQRRGPEVCGGFLTVPVDLTNVAVGRHTLTFAVDPDDSFADLDRDNNTCSIAFNVREPGGTLRVTVKDKDTGAGVSRAHIHLPGLYFSRCDASGVIEIADVPAGDYDARDLWASRAYPEPKYAEQHATGGFTVRNHQVTQATVELEQPVDVIVRLLDGETGEPVFEPASGKLKHTEETSRGTLDDSYVYPYAQQQHLHFPNVPPGACEITGGAYAFQTQTITNDVHRDEKGEYHVDMTLPRKPRGTIEGNVTDHDGHKVTGAEVWLNGAPRSAGTDNDGHYVIAEVEAGRNYQVVSRKRHYVSGRAMSGTLGAEQTATVNLSMAKITQKHASLGFDAVTWAMIESWPGFDFFGLTSSSYKVSAQFGEFSASMGMLYHTVQGHDEVVVDELVLGVVPGLFWRSECSTEYDPLDLVSEAVDTASEAVATGLLGDTAGKAVLQLAKLADPINIVYDYLVDDIDPGQLHDGEVVGTFTSHTGDKYESATLIDLPSTSIPVGVAMGGGQTVVRTDIVEVSDGTHTKRIYRQWYSPKMAVYPIGEEMDLDSLEVTFYIAVLNDRLSPGPLYANSRNVLIWKPMEDKWLRFEPRAYEALPQH